MRCFPTSSSVPFQFTVPIVQSELSTDSARSTGRCSGECDSHVFSVGTRESLDSFRSWESAPSNHRPNCQCDLFVAWEQTQVRLLTGTCSTSCPRRCRNLCECCPALLSCPLPSHFPSFLLWFPSHRLASLRLIESANPFNLCDGRRKIDCLHHIFALLKLAILAALRTILLRPTPYRIRVFLCSAILDLSLGR